MYLRYCIVLLFAIVLSSCTSKNKTILVKNTLAFNRSFETIELNKTLLTLDVADRLENYDIVHSLSKEVLETQTVDTDGDGFADVLLFQCTVKANSEVQYELRVKDISHSIPTLRCYSRFVPERTDDYAWENDRVAFRTFGPRAQKMIEDSIPGGTLTSGIDAWLKKVDYPIIDKWYKKDISGTGSYHKDTGEGLDNFHVGGSRGVGGIAVKQDSLYYVSKNFSSWRTIANGPIRTSFVLTYEHWDVKGNTIEEQKHISLDYGSNLTRYEVSIKGVDTVSVGLTLHENDGITSQNLEKGWLSYWQPHGNSELGMGVVVPNHKMFSYSKEIDIPEKHLYGNLKVTDRTILYYAGFGWKESGQFENKESWESYLKAFALKIENPLLVALK